MQSIPLAHDILIKKVIIREIPLIEVVEGRKANKKLPTVFLFHGYMESKERFIQEAFELAKHGMRVILPEAFLHNERNDKPLTLDDLPKIWTIIASSVNEYQLLKQMYIANGLTDPGRIAVAGSSMGGITVAALLTADPTIKTAAILMGAPDPIQLTEFFIQKYTDRLSPDAIDALRSEMQYLDDINLKAHPELLAGRNVMFWHDTDDKSIPYTFVSEFYESIKDTPDGKNVVLYTTSGKGHLIPYETVTRMAIFFNKHL